MVAADLVERASGLRQLDRWHISVTDIEPEVRAEWCELSSADDQGLRPRRHHRPPPDAQARRLLRQAAPVPARRFRHHRPGHRPRPHGARPWRGRFRAVQGQRHRPGVRGRCGRQVPRRLAVARRPGQRHQRQVQRARRADLLGPARSGRAARRERRLQAQLPAFVAVEGQGHLPLHPAMVHRHGQAARPPARQDPRREALGE